MFAGGAGVGDVVVADAQEEIGFVEEVDGATDTGAESEIEIGAAEVLVAGGFGDAVVEIGKAEVQVGEDGPAVAAEPVAAEGECAAEAVGAMDADVISIETSRSQMELLQTFGKYRYPNEIGPGVYDIHSPRIPTTQEMVDLLKKAASVLSAKQLWVNPDCGLKTRRWEEVRPALVAMVEAARIARKNLA